MNYDHVNKVSDYFRNKIAPHLRSYVNISDFGDYLTKIAHTKSCRWMRQDLRAFPITYFVDPEKFFDKYGNKCIAYTGSTDPREGAMQIVFQLSPEFHVLARLYNWIEKEEVKAYLMLTVVFRNHDDFVEFFDSNKEIRLTGNTEANQHIGFAAGLKTDAPGLAGLIQQLEKDANEAENG